MKATLNVRTLSLARVQGNLEALIAVASDVPGEYWTAENFLHDLPGKWCLSFGLWRNDSLIGYAFLSRKATKHIHLHHFMVTAALRNQGHGARMVNEMLSRCQDAGAEKLTLKTPNGNAGAIRFYAQYGFLVCATERDYTVMTYSL